MLVQYEEVIFQWYHFSTLDEYKEYTELEEWIKNLKIQIKKKRQIQYKIMRYCSDRKSTRKSKLHWREFATGRELKQYDKIEKECSLIIREKVQYKKQSDLIRLRCSNRRKRYLNKNGKAKEENSKIS